MGVCYFEDYGLVNETMISGILQKRGFKLSEKQKKFAVTCALNIVGTQKHVEEKAKTEKRANFYIANGRVRNSALTRINFDKRFKKSAGAHDLRYLVLKNPNWTMEQKSSLIEQFWANDFDYDEAFDNWVLHAMLDGSLCEYIKNQDVMNNYQKVFLFDKEVIKRRLEKTKSKTVAEKQASKVRREFDFCDKMAELRSPSFMRSSVFNNGFYKNYCNMIDKTIKACGLKPGRKPRKNNNCGVEETEEQHMMYMKAKQYYKDHFCLERLQLLAEIIAPEYAKYYFSRKVTERLLIEDGICGVEVPQDEREKLLSKIFFFAKRLELIDGTLLDYNSAVLDSEILRRVGEIYGNSSSEFYSKKLQLLEAEKDKITQFMKVKTPRKKANQ